MIIRSDLSKVDIRGAAVPAGARIDARAVFTAKTTTTTTKTKI